MLDGLTPLALVGQLAPESVDVPMSPVLDQAAMSYFIVKTLESIKRADWIPWVTARTEKLNKILAVVLSGFAAVGIVATYDAGTGTLVVTGLTASSVLLLAWAWARSYAIQQWMFYSMIYKKPSVEQLQEVKREAKVTPLKARKGKK